MNEKAFHVSSNRNYGIDALRLFSMFLIIILHILGKGGVLASTSGTKFAIGWFLEIAAYCAVNCFGLISGYAAYSEQEKEYRYSKYISLWMQVAFYSFGITLLAFIISPQRIGLLRLIKSALPVATSHYWYFTAYTALFFVIPWLNRLVRSCSEKELHIFILILFLLFSCYATFSSMFKMIFNLNNGYSFLWLAVLYLIGAWIKKCAIHQHIKSSLAAVGLLACILLNWGPSLLFKDRRFITYNNPGILLMSVAYVIIFSKIQFGSRSKKILACFAPAAFGVYLIHVQDLVWTHLMSSRFAWISNYSVWALPVLVIGCAIIMLIVLLFIEKLRIQIFRVLRINELAQKICSKICVFFHRKFV